MKMRESDDSSEIEPLVPGEHVRGISSPSPSSVLLVPQHFTRDVKALEIVAVFIVAFDTRHGNIVEWAKPEFMKEQLGGLEFKAMPSGAHNLDNDVVYLYEANLYGVACYSKIRVQSSEERGVRMRSVGVLMRSHDLLHVHKKELSKLVRYVLDHPGDYTQLEEYYQTWTGDFLTTKAEYISSLSLSYPRQHFERLLSSLGPSVFTVWKAMLLRRRIMFYSPPPAADLCHLVYCTNFLMSHSVKIRKNLCTPFYFVNIADSDTLLREVSYIACTTEKVFETKTNMYDVYIDEDTVRITTDRLKPILCVTKGDKARLGQLYSTMRQPVSCDDTPATVEDNFYSYFSQLNRNIATRINRLSGSDESRLTSQDVEAMGLHSSDAEFINELLESLNLEMTVGCSVCCSIL